MPLMEVVFDGSWHNLLLNWDSTTDIAQFYIDVFNCVPVYPERDLSGNWIDKLTSVMSKIN